MAKITVKCKKQQKNHNFSIVLINKEIDLPSHNPQAAPAAFFTFIGLPQQELAKKGMQIIQ